MNPQHYKSRQQEQLSRRLVELSSVIFNLKSIAYSMANIPLETVKLKSPFCNSSLASTIDSIFFDLKRIQTILLKHTNHTKSPTLNPQSHLSLSKSHGFIPQSYHHLSKTPAFIPSYNHRSNFSNSTSNPTHNLKTTQCATFHIQTQNHHHRNPSQANHNYKVAQKQAFKSQLNLIDCHFQPKQVSQYSSVDENLKFISNTLLINECKKRKKSHEVGISHVSSYEYVGLSQNPTIKGRYNKISDEDLNPSDGQKKSDKANNYCQEEKEKELENEKFLREISKSRQKILKSIEGRKAKCLNTIKNLNSNLIERSPFQQSKLKKGKLKSKTQKFYTQGSKLNENQIEPQEWFVGI